MIFKSVPKDTFSRELPWSKNHFIIMKVFVTLIVFIASSISATPPDSKESHPIWSRPVDRKIELLSVTKPKSLDTFLDETLAKETNAISRFNPRHVIRGKRNHNKVPLPYGQRQHAVRLNSLKARDAQKVCQFILNCVIGM